MTALLEFCLGAAGNHKARIRTAEHLATLLCSEGRGDGRRVTRDPASLTPRIRSFCEQIEAASDLDHQAIERELVEAARRMNESPSEELAREIHARKAALGRSLFAPPILRATVYFNASLSSTHAPVEDDAPAWSEAAKHAPGPSVVPDARVEPELEAPPPAEAAGGLSEVSEVRWSIAEDPLPARPAAPVRSPGAQRRLRRRLFAGAGLATAAVLAAGIWLRGPQGTVQSFSMEDLSAVSARLDSGYRGGFGFGPLFIGRVTPDWSGLSAHERTRSAQEIVGRLEPQGVREILLYEEHNRLALHFAAGRPLRVSP